MIRAIFILTALTSVSLAAADDFSVVGSIVSPDAANYDAYGSDVAFANAATLCVGVRGADAQGSNAGAVDIFNLTSEGWAFIQRPTAVGLQPGDQLGEAVAGNNTWFAAGATRHDAMGVDSGAVWMFRNNQTNWAHAQRLLPPVTSAGARFGSALALEQDTLVIGAPLHSGGGSVSIFTQANSTWTHALSIANPTPGASNRFGESVALAGDWLAVGDPYDDAVIIDGGAVYLYRHVASAWILTQTLRPTQTVAREYFGQSLSIDGTRLAIGVYGANSGAETSGRVEMFEVSDGSWQQRDEIVPLAPIGGGNFGWDIALSGDRLAVGAPGAGVAQLSGIVTYYTHTPKAGWTAIVDALLVNGQAQDLLGACVALRDGQLAIGAPGAPDASGTSAPRGVVAGADFSQDCNGDGIPDAVELARGAADCDLNSVPDACQPDDDGDGIPNTCEPCIADLNGDGLINGFDFSLLLNRWGAVPAGEPADLDEDGNVGASDVALLLNSWGNCEL